MEKVKEVALAIKRWMAENDLSMTDMAERLGVTVQAVSSQLDGKRIFGRGNAGRYAEAFGFDADYLMTGKGELLNHEHMAVEEGGDVSTLIAIVKSQQDTIAALVNKLA